ncbi:hypothetical protein [uncultured Maribacter sp.]|uniref:hypothetical protein n=1 Tax=uncultured Maribacter sp. TaxID=431308 RepID=UPI0030DCBB95|tara:strand:+ start:56 stop:274 length:219 start_codon:yes stop_codon:yes gene_type:complete
MKTLKTDALMQKMMNKYGFDETTSIGLLPVIITDRMDLQLYLLHLRRKTATKKGGKFKINKGAKSQINGKFM